MTTWRPPPVARRARAACGLRLAAAWLASAAPAARAQAPPPVGNDGAPRLSRATRPVPYPAVLRGAGDVSAVEVVVTATVDTAGRMIAATRSVTSRATGGPTPGPGRPDGPLELFAAAARQASRAWRFTPALAAKRPVAAPVAVLVRFAPVPEPWADTPLRTCSDCDEERERTRELVQRSASRAAACAAALREAARTNPTDTLVWAVDVVPRCEGAVDAAALGVRLMAYGYHADSTLTLRARLAARVPSAAAFDAALAVVRHGYSAAQRYAFEVLDQLGPAVPHGIGDATRGAGGCGALVLETGFPEPAPVLPPPVRAAYRRDAFALATRIAADPASPAPVRAAARCVAADLEPAAGPG